MKKGKNSSMIYGIRAVIESIQSGTDFEKVFLQKNLKGDLIHELLPLLGKSGVPVVKVPVERLNKFTRKNHQGVVAFRSPIKHHRLSDLIAATFEGGKNPFFVILDRITDVRNFGAIARTAEGMGADGIVIPAKGAAQINEDSIKTSAGALALIPVCRENDLRESIRYLKESGIRIVGCTEKAKGKIQESHLSDPLAIVLGSEENGISQSVLDLCDEEIRIPMAGSIDSLNVSVAAAICFYEVLRQRT